MMDQILPDNQQPLYLQLKEIFVKKIKAEELQIGEKLPSERELCEKYNVSRITVRQALAELSKEGMIYRSHGKGTFVSQAKLEQGLFNITPFHQSLLGIGLKPKTKFINYQEIANSYHMSKTLGIPLAENISELNLLGLGNEEPMSFYTSYHSLDIGKKVYDIVQQLIKEDSSFTTLDIYNRLPELKLGNIYQTFEASISDTYISNILNIKKGSPILIVESTLYTISDQPLEHRTAIYRGDKYKFSIVRRLQNN